MCVWIIFLQEAFKKSRTKKNYSSKLFCVIAEYFFFFMYTSNQSGPDFINFSYLSKINIRQSSCSNSHIWWVVMQYICKTKCFLNYITMWYGLHLLQRMFAILLHSCSCHIRWNGRLNGRVVTCKPAVLLKIVTMLFTCLKFISKCRD